jgi:F420-non-reducing hydrogenase large subunit
VLFRSKEYAKFTAQQYRDYVAEHVEPWSYMKFTFLKSRGWKGFVEGPDSSIYSVGPLARLNAADGMATPKAQAAYEEMYKTLGGKPVHHTLANPEYVKLITSDAYTHKTCYLGMVDAQNKVNFYDGQLRVVDCDGKEVSRFAAQQYRDFVAEHVEPWSYMKFTFLKNRGWKGFTEGPESSIYSVGPLARLNAADGMATPQAQAAYEEFYQTLGGKPVHHTLANHWARVIEMIYAAERMEQLIGDPEITSTEIRRLPTAVPKIGIGVVEAPRGTLFHHYETDEQGLIRKANLIVATGNNAARIAMSVERAAKGLIKRGHVTEGLLNKIEMAFRAYDPCLGCATHSLPAHLPLRVNIYDPQRNLLRQLVQG